MKAFAVPGGYLYIPRQLVGLMNAEAELASVLGHEAGHIAARHSSERQRTGILSQLGALLVGVVTGSGQLAQLAGQVSQGIFLKYSRSQEYEADDLGVRYIAAAGYDPLASASFLGSLGAATSLESRASGRNDERSTPSWARSHPLSAARVTRATQKAQRPQRGRGLRNRDLSSPQATASRRRRPEAGVVDGRNFVHPICGSASPCRAATACRTATRAVSIRGSRPGPVQRRPVQRRPGRLHQAGFQSVVGAAAGSSTPSRAARRSTASGRLLDRPRRHPAEPGRLTIIAYRWDADTPIISL